MMLRSAWFLVFLVALGLATNVSAQAPTVGDVPSGIAQIRGRVTLADGHPAPNVEIVLYALQPAGSPGVRRVESDAQGDFAFVGISNDPGIAYLVGARYGGVPFSGGRVAFAADENERVVDIAVSSPSSDMGALEVLDVWLAFNWLGKSVRVTETHRLHNSGPSVIHVPEGARAGKTPAFRAELLAGAREFAMPFGVVPEGVVREGAGLEYWGPLYPGDNDFTFTYDIDVEGGGTNVTKRLPAGAKIVHVLAPETGMRVTGEGLRAGETIPFEGRSYHQLDSETVSPGGRLALRLVQPEVASNPDSIQMGEVRLFLELDEAALSASEEYNLRVVGGDFQASPEGSSLLDVSIPESAVDVRFPSDTLELGVRAEENGVALTGPVAPGPAVLGVAYRIPFTGGTLDFARTVSRSVPHLSIFIADTGVGVLSDRLHRRKPVRSNDRVYIHFEAFQLEAGETFSLSLTPLLPPSAPPLAAVAALAIAAALAAGWFMTAPLRRGNAEAEPATAPAAAGERERDALYEAIRDLEHDFETGKLSQTDYDELRLELRTRAGRLLQRDEQAAPTPPVTSAPPPSELYCTSCGKARAQDDRFCSQCGKPHGSTLGKTA